MKKLNAFTLIAIFSISVAVILAGVIATSPVAGGDAAPQQPAMTIPF